MPGTTATRTVRISTVANTTYKLRAWATTPAQILSDTNGRSSLGFHYSEIQTAVLYAILRADNSAITGSNEGLDRHSTHPSLEGNTPSANAIIATGNTPAQIKVRVTGVSLAGTASAQIDAGRSFLEITRIA